MNRRFALTAALLIGGCGSSPSTSDGGADLATPAGDLASPAGDGGCASTTDEAKGCQPLASDYTPRANSSKDDPWPACISDDNSYHLIAMGAPGGAARAVAWDNLAKLLWRNPKPLTVDDFVRARNEYTLPNGIGSRIERRQDIHYPEIPNNNKLKCSEMGLPAMYPDRCAGPARLVPLINDAFQKALAGTEPLVQSARLEAGLLWFFYLSVPSEIWTCGFEATDDCDGALGHYNAAQPRTSMAGLAGYVAPLSPATHDRVFDGLLAMRCWRDLDRALPSTRPDLYQRALDQVDRALIRGLALILRQRFGRLPCLTGEPRKAQVEFIRIIGGLLDRAARAVDPAGADQLKAQVTAAAEQIDPGKAQQALDALFPCP